MPKKRLPEEIKKLRETKDLKGFKIVVVGKGGAGKTTITALLAETFVKMGYRVLAVDEDPQMNLPFALGYPIEKFEELKPLSENLDYIEEKTGARPGENWGIFLRLNPPVEDVVKRFGTTLRPGLSFLLMGTVHRAATGCLCPENALLNAVIKHISLGIKDLVILDTQAGVEHFGRAIAKGFSQCLIITDITFNSFSVASHAAKLSKELGIKRIHLIINRIASEETLYKAQKLINQFHLNKISTKIFFLPFEKELQKIEPAVINLYKINPDSELLKKIKEIAITLEEAEREK